MTNTVRTNRQEFLDALAECIQESSDESSRRLFQAFKRWIDNKPKMLSVLKGQPLAYMMVDAIEEGLMGYFIEEEDNENA